MARFASATDKDIEEIIAGKEAVNTVKLNGIFLNVLKSYCEEKRVTFVVESISRDELAKILCRFYVEVRRADGTIYKLTSFRSLRFALQRCFKNIRGLDYDILENVEFKEANNIYMAQTVKLKKEGFAKIDHHPPLSSEDLHKLYSSDVYSMKNPSCLQMKVFFDIMYYFCRRGRENLRKLTVNDFTVKTKLNGNEYVEKVSDELSKNHRENDENEDVMIMEATGEEGCPVTSFKFYLSKLNPKLPQLFQRAKKSTPTDGPWYDNMVVGEKSLGSMMKSISHGAKLSRAYTNHSIRATAITVLNSNGVEGRDIISLSGHRSINSLQSYCKTTDSRKRAMSQMLSEAVGSSSNAKNIRTSKEMETVTRTFDFGINLSEQSQRNNVFKLEGCQVTINNN